jgi:hypothetical protein
MDPTERSIVPRRVAGVSLALAGTGGLIGAGLSAGLAALGGIGMRAAGLVVPSGTILMSAGVGAALGALLTPLTAMSLLRQVALGKALLFTMLGMSAGVAAGELVRGQTLVSTAAGFGAFLVVALALRMRTGLSRGRKTANRQASDSDKA